MALPLNCMLLCASGAAYDIDPTTGRYSPDPVFSKAVSYSTDPVAVSVDNINACALLPQVMSAVKGLNPSSANPIYITGHSKGGGMAPLAAYLMQQGSAVFSGSIAFRRRHACSQKSEGRPMAVPFVCY